MAEPLRPSEVPFWKTQSFPNEVIETWNLIIAKNYDDGFSEVLQSEIVKALADKLDVNSNAIYASKFLNIEDIYREYGWKVTYDKPGYNESYPAKFIFEK